MKQLLLLCAMFLAAPAVAETQPQPGIGDPRIQTVFYDPDQVVQLHVAVGYQLTVEFAADERIENIAVGDGGAWQITPNKRGDHVFIKVSPGGSSTNLTVVTDVRTYAFALAPGSDGSSDTPFTVRFRYPPPAVSVVAAPANAAVRYKLSGTRALRPTLVTDDGRRTYIVFADDQAMPAVFTLGADGKEQLVNGAVREGRYVIDGVSNQLLFRIDKLTASARRVPKRKGL
jgi:type IV secretion system protein VirB9